MEVILIVLVLGLFFAIYNISGKVSRMEQELERLKSEGLGVVQAQSADTLSAPILNEAPLSPAPVPPTYAPQGIQTSDIFSARSLTVVGILAVVCGVGFFFKLAIDMGWISQWGRIIIGMSIGGLLMLLGDVWRNKYPSYASALGGGGLALLYLSIWLGSELYSLYSSNLSFILLVAVSVGGVLYAHRHQSKYLEIGSFTAALTAPMFGHLGANNQISLFVYLTLANLVILVFTFRRFSLERLYVAVLGNILNSGVWALNSQANSNSIVTFVYLTVTAIIFVSGVVQLYKDKYVFENIEPKTLDQNNNYLAFLEIVVAVAFVTAMYGVFTKDYYAPLAVIGALVYLIAYISIGRQEYKIINYTLLSATAGFLVLAVFEQFNGDIARILGILAIGLVGVTAAGGYKRKDLLDVATGVAFLGLVGSFFQPFVDTAVMLVNSRFGLEIVAIGVLLIAGMVYQKLQPDDTKSNFKVLVSALALAFWLAVSVELVHYINNSAAQLIFSLWTLFFAAAVFTGHGAWRILRKMGLGLLVFAIVKVFLYDSSALEIAYRIVSFLVLGVILLSVSFFYQRNREKIKEFLS
jgi:uncharacterized membrane protein